MSSAAGAPPRRSRDAEHFAETRLPGGIRVLTETVPGVRSVAVGVWVRQGAAHEEPGERGLSHLLEHMAFKGTRTRSARELALALERLGGSLDAYTTREHTTFQARVLDEHLPEAMDVLADLVESPALRPRDLELEREVVLGELAEVEDTPGDLVFELHADLLWDGHPYGRSILGTRETVSGAEASDLRALHDRAYRGDNLIVAAAGRVEHDRLAGLTAELFHREGTDVGRPPPPVPAAPGAAHEVVPREGAQTHLVFGARTPPHSDARRYPLVLLARAFGGGMSSRLFQRIREELALAYSVYSFQSFYSRAGVTGVYVGTRPEWADRAVEAVREEYARLAGDGLDDGELEAIKSQVKGQVMLSLESTGARLYRLAGFGLYDESFQSLDELLARIDAVTPEEVASVAAETFDPEDQVVLRLGPEGPSG